MEHNENIKLQNIEVTANTAAAEEAAVEEPTVIQRKGIAGAWDNFVEGMYRLVETTKGKILVFGILLIAVGTMPLWASSYVLQVAWNAMFYMLLAIGCNIIVGYCGMCVLGYAAKFAVGAYPGQNPWLEFLADIAGGDHLRHHRSLHHGRSGGTPAQRLFSHRHFRLW